MARTISASFAVVSENVWIDDSVLTEKAAEVVALKGENRYRWMAVQAVQSGGVAEAKAFFKDLWPKVQSRFLEEFFEGAKTEDLSEAKRADFHRRTGWYRSNKSVVMQAIELGIDVLDADNAPLGKTAVQTAIKQLKAKLNGEVDDDGNAVGKSALQQYTERLAGLDRAAAKLDDSDRKLAIKLAEQHLARLKAGETDEE